MMRLRIPAVVKLVIGVLLLQSVTAVLVVAALRSADLGRDGPLFVLAGAIVGLLAALWFSSITAGHHKQAIAEAREGFSREREKLRVKAEKEKARVMVNSHKKATRQGTARGGIGINPKSSIAVVGAVGIGTVLLFSQFVTLGLAALAAVGGSVLGYRVRSYQESRGAALPFGSRQDKTLPAASVRQVTAKVDRLEKP